MEDRIVRVEEKIAYMEQTLSELSKLVWHLGREVASLRQVSQDLKKHLTPIDTDRKPEEDVPPHY